MSGPHATCPTLPRKPGRIGRGQLLAAAMVALGGAVAGCGEGAETVRVSGGEFVMGCRGKPGCTGEEQPAHKVTLSSYSIDKYEVSWSDYRRCVRRHDCSDAADGDDADAGLPVTGVTWDQAREYCEAQGRRLPTEAEWERAARGTDERIFPWGDESPNCDRAVTYGCGSTPRSANTSRGRSPEGAYHMAGNVREWVADHYGQYPGSAQMDPKGPSSGDRRVNRGGSYKWGPEEARTTARVGENPATASPDLGFRCAD